MAVKSKPLPKKRVFPHVRYSHEFQGERGDLVMEFIRRRAMDGDVNSFRKAILVLVDAGLEKELT